MNKINRPYPSDESTNFSTAQHEEIDLIISRLIGGEVNEQDQEVFERFAEAQPDLWRELALRMRDAAALSAGVQREVNRAERIELPVACEPMAFSAAVKQQAGWALAAVGWAAVVAMAIVWRLGDPTGHAAPPAAIQHAGLQVTPEEQLRSYLQAPYVVGELNPLMEKVDELPDGRIAVVALRRIQEVIFLDENQPLPVDDDRQFLMDPAELRLARQ